MKIDDILEEWKNDVQLDKTELGEEALNIPRLHHKYYQILIKEKMLLRQQEAEMKTLAFWGVAFKPRTDDIREAPSMTLMKRALDAGAKVKAFDPVAMENLAKEMPQVERAADMYACVQDADALVICTEWREFRSPDLDRVKAALKRPLIVDGRNLYRCETMQEHGFDYASVGRATARGAGR